MHEIIASQGGYITGDLQAGVFKTGVFETGVFETGTGNGPTREPLNQ